MAQARRASAETVADVEALDWPAPEAPRLVAADACERAEAVHERGEQVTAVSVVPIFHLGFLDELLPSGQAQSQVPLHAGQTANSSS